jgi:type 1 fimbria pilin
MRAFHFSRYLGHPVVLPLFLISTKVFAAVGDCSGPLPIVVNIPAVAVPTSLAVGQSIPGARASFTIALTCSPSLSFPAGSHWWMKNNPNITMTPVSGYSDVYTMSGMLAGIGFRMRGANGAVLVPINYGGTTNAFDLGPAAIGSNVLQGAFELVKISQSVATGSFSFSAYASVNDIAYANGGTAPASTLTFGYTVKAAAVAACSVSQSDVNVTLPTVAAKEFASVGATAGVKTFALSLTCEDNAKPQISLTDVVNPSNQSTELSLAPGSTATGLAMQILYGSTLVRYGPAPYSYTDGKTPASANGIDLTVGSGGVQIPFSVRYVRTGTPVTAGSVRGMATFSMSYQ